MNGGSFGLLMFFANEMPFGLGLEVFNVSEHDLKEVKVNANNKCSQN
jgi:hypothetical protein